MNVFMPEKPVVAILLNPEGQIEKVSHNLLNTLEVSVTDDREEFAEQSKGLEFTKPQQ